MSITGFVLSFTCCLSLVGAILGLVGLGRTRQGRRGGRWAAVSAIAVGFSLTLLAAGFVTWAVVTDEPIDELRTGDCFDAEGLGGQADEGGVDVSDVEETSCEDPHDAEVLAVDELSVEQAEEFEDDPVAVCRDLFADRGLDPAIVGNVGPIVPILDSVRADRGETLVCALAAGDGSRLRGPYAPFGTGG